MIKVWGRPNSINVQKVMWTLGELELAHERIDAGGAFGGLDTPAYVRLNPNRRIPTIEDGDFVLWESNSIVRYLAASYGEGRLCPPHPRGRAAAEQWMDWQLSTLLPPLHLAFVGLIRTAPEERDEAAIARAGEELAGRMRLLDAQLQGRAFLLGEHFTMADIPLGACAYRWYGLETLPHPELPALRAWYERLTARAPFRRHVMLPLT